MKNLFRSFLYCITIFTFVFINLTSFAQEGTGPVINEVMSLNTTTIQDEDGDYSDWIELFNAGSSTVDLTGWGLSDDTLEPLKWTFQGGSLVPGQRLLVFASDKDRSVVTNHWETVITHGDEWNYFIGTSEPPADWRSNDFDDSGWESGPSGFGYGDDDDATTINLREIAASLYIRTAFTVDDPSNIVDGFLHIDYDDGFVAYINGAEIARANIGSPGTVPAYNETTDTNREATGAPESYSISDIQPLLVAGENVLTIQGHNASLGSSDFSLIPFLTLGMTVPPEIPGGISEEIDLSNVYQHLNFKIKSDGETLFLTDNTGAIVDSVITGLIYEDMSLGRKPDGGAEWVIFNEPTPGTANGEGVFQGFADSVQVSHSGGFHDGGILLELSTESPDAVIVFTVNGDYPVYDGVDDPADSMFVYTEPIAIDSTIVIRAQAFEDGKLSSPLLTQTYLIDEDITLPVISLTTPPAGLWSDESGIYVPGDVPLPYSHWGGNPRANWWEPWERQTHLEFYETDGSLGFEQDVGIETIGGWGRYYVRKSLAIFARSIYGKGSFDYKLFPDLPFTEYEAFVLRCSGNDYRHTLFHDAMVQSLIEDLDVETMAYRPVIVFLNGVYWGIHNMREKQNEHYLKQHHPEIDIDNLDRLGNYGPSVTQGSGSDFSSLRNYITNNDMNLDEHYEYVKTKIDIENYINYYSTQVYIDNGDWPGYNIKYWRPRTPEGKYRWMLFDTDAGFNGYGKGAQHDTFTFATTPNGDGWPNPPLSTVILRNLFESETFRNDYINRTCDHLNTIFTPEHINERIASMKAVIEPEMPRHIERWYGINNQVLHGLYGNIDQNWLEDMDQWEERIQIRIDWAAGRQISMYPLMVDFFNLSGSAMVNLDVSQPGAGTIKLNSITPGEYPWSGKYLRDIPIQVTALPNPGYRFVGWSGAASGDSTSCTIIPQRDITVTAMFESTGSTSLSLVINEINYSATDTVDPGDWIELYNPYGVPVDISGWILKDSDDAHSFTIPENTVIVPGGYIVLCENTSRFITVYHGVDNHTGDFDFGLSSLGESVRLYDTQGALIDSVTYDDDSPWPRKRDDGVYTLALLSVSGDNTVPANWGLTPDNGSPGLPNTIFVGVESVEQLSAPSAFSLGENFPNPFNPSTTFRYELPVDSHVEFVVYDILGRKVAILKDSMTSAGVHESVWNGRDINGMLVGSGVYLYRFRAQDYVKQGKVMFLR